MVAVQGTSTAGGCRYRQAIPVGRSGLLDVDTMYGLRKGFLPRVSSFTLSLKIFFIFLPFWLFLQRILISFFCYFTLLSRIVAICIVILCISWIKMNSFFYYEFKPHLDSSFLEETMNLTAVELVFIYGWFWVSCVTESYVHFLIFFLDFIADLVY